MANNRTINTALIILSFLMVWLAGLALPACSGSGAATYTLFSMPGDTLKMRHARNIVVVEYANLNLTTASLRNPWDTTKILARYVIAPEGVDIPELPEDATVLRTPIKRSLVYSSVHINLIDELGALHAVKGVCDRRYIQNDNMVARMASGDVADCGSGMAPDPERIMLLRPDAILLSPYEETNACEKIDKLGIPIVQCADYVEVSPLARAEWVRFFGRLYDRAAESDSLFNKIEKAYLELKQKASNANRRPKVLMDRLYGNVWYVPAEVSTMATFLRDAGAENPFDRFKKTGSSGLSAEEILLEAENADFWLIRYAKADGSNLSANELVKDNPVYARFKALEKGNALGCNTSVFPYYEDTPFHPHWLLENLIGIFHPELADSIPSHVYFTQLSPK